MPDIEDWSDAAAQWIDWVRTENHDAFWAYRSAFERFVGRGEGEAVEFGAGEGRISRVLAGLGWRMTLVEPVAPLLAAAREAHSAQTYVSAPARSVPLPDAAFDLGVLYNMLMDVDDLPGTLAEAARVLKPGGRMVVGIVHPILDVVHDRENGQMDTPYFETKRVDNTCARGGLEMRFRGWRRPLSAYINALSEAGLAIKRMAEPAPDPDHPASARLSNGKVLPVFLWLDLHKPAAPASHTCEV